MGNLLYKYGWNQIYEPFRGGMLAWAAHIIFLNETPLVKKGSVHLIKVQCMTTSTTNYSR